MYILNLQKGVSNQWNGTWIGMWNNKIFSQLMKNLSEPNHHHEYTYRVYGFGSTR